LSEKGRRPGFSKEGNICRIFNGEIYNFKEIMADLEKEGYQLIQTQIQKLSFMPMLNMELIV